MRRNSNSCLLWIRPFHHDVMMIVKVITLACALLGGYRSRLEAKPVIKNPCNKTTCENVLEPVRLVATE